MTMSAPAFQRQPIAGLLVAAITPVDLMHMNLHSLQLARDRYGFVAAAIVHQDNQVHQLLLANFLVRLAQRERGIVRRHYHHNFLSAVHSRGLRHRRAPKKRAKLAKASERLLGDARGVLLHPHDVRVIGRLHDRRG